MDLYSLCFNATTRDAIATALNISTTDIDNQICLVSYSYGNYYLTYVLVDLLVAGLVLVLLLLIVILVLAIALCCVAKKLKR